MTPYKALGYDSDKLSLKNKYERRKMHKIKKQCLLSLCKLTYLAIIIFTIAFMLGCSQNQIPSSPVPSFTEPPIPSNYQTYTDETSAFRISYPSNWEVANSLLEGIGQDIKDTIKSIDSKIPIEKASVIFFAGLHFRDSYAPNVNIVVEPLPNRVKNQDQLIEAEILGIKTITSDYSELSRIKTKLDGIDSNIVEYTATFPDASKSHYVFMCLYKGQTVWGVTCISTPEDFDKWKGDFQSIVRSLRILK
jgi:hypothetical protein